MLSPNIARLLKSSPEWQELEKHIKQEMDELYSINNIDFLDKERAAIDGRGRQLAIDVLKKIMEPFFSQEQKKIDVYEVTKGRAGL